MEDCARIDENRSCRQVLHQIHHHYLILQHYLLCRKLQYAEDNNLKNYLRLLVGFNSRMAVGEAGNSNKMI
jgi:hypothetical protein